MRTFLTTDRMSPELRARVERAVSHGTRARQSAATLGLPGPFAADRRIGVARVLPVLAALLVAALAAGAWLYDKRAVEAERAAILAEIAARRAALPPSHAGLLDAIAPILAAVASADPAPDLVDPAVRGAIDGALARPAVYVRASAADLRDPARLALAARGSDKDAFLACLVRPPPGASERDLLERVRGVYFAGAKVDADTAGIRRLAEARLALAPTAPAFEASVRAATEFAALHRLRRELDAAPLDLARRAAATEIVVVVADLPPDTARAAIVEVATGNVLVRASRRPRELGKSAAAALYRDQLEACDLALAMRAVAQ